ncbi:MAG: YkvA family protein [Myxococcota bacterium]
MAAKTKISFSLDDSDLAYFRAIFRAAKKNAAEVDRSKIEHGVQRLIKDVRSTKRAPHFVLEAVQTLEDLLGVLDDEAYAAPASVHRSVLAALAYFGDAKDVIPDDIPMVGFLDDAIMIKLVEEELRHELWGYRKFCKFRDGAEQRPWSRVAKGRLPQRLKEKRDEIRAAIREREERDRAA